MIELEISQVLFIPNYSTMYAVRLTMPLSFPHSSECVNCEFMSHINAFQEKSINWTDCSNLFGNFEFQNTRAGTRHYSV